MTGKNAIGVVGNGIGISGVGIGYNNGVPGGNSMLMMQGNPGASDMGSLIQVNAIGGGGGDFGGPTTSFNAGGNSRLDKNDQNQNSRRPSTNKNTGAPGSSSQSTGPTGSS